MKKSILVLGSNGTVGQHLVKNLLAKGHSVRAASRSGKTVEGAEGIAFDYADAATYGPAFEGIDAAYIMLPGGYVQITELLLPVIAEAAKRNIKVVFQSVYGVDADDSIPYRQVELALEKSGTPWVTLRPNWFADNFHTFWKAGLDHGVIQLPAAEGKSAFIDARDIAASAAAALDSDEFNGKAFNLTGPKALSYAEAGVILGEVIGKSIEYTSITDEAFIEVLMSVGIPEDYSKFLASIFYPVREGWTAPTTEDVKTLTGNEPRSLETYAKDYAGALKA